MNARKQKNGKWRTQVYLGMKNGKRVYKSITANTKAECLHLANLAKTKGVKSTDRRTLRDVVDKYIDSITDVVSPTTIRSYKAVARYAFQPIMDMDVDDIDDIVMQNAINEESRRITAYGKKISAKTVNSEYGVIETSLRRVCGKVYNVKLPQIPTKIKEFPLPQDIMRAIKGKDIELPCLLAMWLSLSMSEIKGLDCSSVRSGVLHVEQVRIETESGEQVKKSGKVGTRIRNHVLPEYIMSLINNTGTYKKYCETGENQPLITMTRNEIYKHWKKICYSEGWAMTFHDLRAVSASVCLLLNIPDKYALERGGWSTTEVYKRVYQMTFSDERLAVDKRINDYFEQFL